MRYSKTLFTPSIETKSYVTEASDLQGFVPGESITLTCEVADHQAVFRYEATHRDGSPDDEITHWTYVPMPQTLVAIPRLEGWCLTVFND